jgi:hypothetical protein
LDHHERHFLDELRAHLAPGGRGRILDGGRDVGADQYLDGPRERLAVYIDVRMLVVV